MGFFDRFRKKQTVEPVAQPQTAPDPVTQQQVKDDKDFDPTQPVA